LRYTGAKCIYGGSVLIYELVGDIMDNVKLLTLNWP